LRIVEAQDNAWRYDEEVDEEDDDEEDDDEEDEEEDGDEVMVVSPD
jgi:hypothetical protein